MFKSRIFCVLVGLASCVLVGCSKPPAAAPAEAAKVAEPSEPALERAAPKTESAATSASVRPVTPKVAPDAAESALPTKGPGKGSPARRALLAYEVVRKALAADDLAAAQAAAKALSQAADTGLKSAAPGVAKAKDLEAARLAFGPLAKAAITLAARDKEAGKGALAWLCPMAKGYQKWVQLDRDMANPYMGKKMLKCGGRVPLSP